MKAMQIKEAVLRKREEKTLDAGKRKEETGKVNTQMKHCTLHTRTAHPAIASGYPERRCTIAPCSYERGGFSPLLRHPHMICLFLSLLPA